MVCFDQIVSVMFVDVLSVITIYEHLGEDTTGAGLVISH